MAQRQRRPDTHHVTVRHFTPAPRPKFDLRQRVADLGEERVASFADDGYYYKAVGSNRRPGAEATPAHPRNVVVHSAY